MVMLAERGPEPPPHACMTQQTATSWLLVDQAAVTWAWPSGWPLRVPPATPAGLQPSLPSTSCTKMTPICHGAVHWRSHVHWDHTATRGRAPARMGQTEEGRMGAYQHRIQLAHVHACAARQLQEGGDAGSDARAIAHQVRMGPNELRFILLCPQRHVVYRGRDSIAGVLSDSFALRVWCRRTEAMQTHLCRRLVGDRWRHWERWRLRMQMLLVRVRAVAHTTPHDEEEALCCPVGNPTSRIAPLLGPRQGAHLPTCAGR